MEPANWTISKLVQKFLDKEIKLPEIQRKYVWKRDKVRTLIDSIYKGYPSGSILLWETDQPPDTRDAAVEKNSTHEFGTTLLLLDGQQRLTSLATVLSGIPIKSKVGASIKETSVEVYFNMNHPDSYQEYDTSDEFKNTADDYTYEDEEEQDKEHLIFQLKSKKIENKPYWIPVTKLFREGLGSVLEEKGITSNDPNYNKYLQRLGVLYNRKDNYHYPVQILNKDKSYAEVTDVFVRVNSAGMKLRTADLALAQITSRWIGSMELFSQVVAECQDKNFDLDEGFLMKCLVSVSTGQNRFQFINKIPLQQFKDDWEKTKKGIHFAIDFLKENAKIETSGILLYPFIIVALVCLAVKNNYKFSNDLERQVLRWVYAASMWGRYSRGATETALDVDLSAINKHKNPVEYMIKNILAQSGRLKIEESDIEGKNTRSAFFTMSYVLAKHNNAKDWGSGIVISLQHVGKEFKNNYDHIFPRSKLESFLKKRYVDDQKVKRMVNDIANIAFLRKQNNSKSNKLPQEYFKTIVNEHGEEALLAQNITVDDSLWVLENYEAFLKDRRRRLVDGINDIMEKLETNQLVIEKPLREILSEGESLQVEFKSSLRWDYKQNKINEKLADPILKTLVAFMNTDGGTLYVGVGNDGDILGIEKDFGDWRQANWDGWSQAFTNIINTRIGKEYHGYIKPTPIISDNKTVAKIEIKKSLKEVFVDPNKPTSEFYIRAGTTTQKLNSKEMVKYIRDNFHS